MVDTKVKAVEEVKTPKSKTPKDYTFAVGRRRAAVARVRLYESVKDGLSWGDKAVKKGEMFVNGLPIQEYFPSDIHKFAYTEPFRVTNTSNKYTVTIKVVGGGQHGQLEAAALGIANALVKLDPEKYRALLKKKSLLTRDDRIRERRKVGTGGKARRQKQSPKR